MGEEVVGLCEILGCVDIGTEMVCWRWKGI